MWPVIGVDDDSFHLAYYKLRVIRAIEASNSDPAEIEVVDVERLGNRSIFYARILLVPQSYCLANMKVPTQKRELAKCL